ncbi:MAG TPA: hypothetical protein VK912_03395 [Longimicrobiales bacterium]|nr:hypothetical protein [Longimicrobiales bacterium]
MRIVVGCTLVLTLVACGASSPNEGRSREDLVRVGSQDGRTIMLPIQHDDFTGGGIVEAPRETLWRLLPVVYEELGLPAPAADPSIWTVAVQNHTTSRRIGDTRMSEMIDCGMGLTGPHADSHRIRMSVRTWLEPAATGTKVITRVESNASSTEGTAGSFVCSSRGQLEARIANALRRHTTQ